MRLTKQSWPRRACHGTKDMKMSKHIRTITLRDGTPVPAIGQGTWYMGDDAEVTAREVASLRAGLDLGISLIDTAEMYGEGASERVVREALKERRETAFLVTKVLPENGDYDGVLDAFERSRVNLGVERIDLYLLHWRLPETPLRETIAAFEALRADGKIGAWGVSNFDVADMEELLALPGGSKVAVNQVLYNLSSRGIEYDLLPWSRQHRIPIMAYSPLDQGRLLRHPDILRLAKSLNITASQLALSFVLRKDNVIAIPKTGSDQRLRENIEALCVALSQDTLDQLDQIFPPPSSKQPLAEI